MQRWAQELSWINGGPFVGDKRPRGVVTVEKDWGLKQSGANKFMTPIVELHNFYPGTVRWFQRAVWDPDLETVIPGVKQIEIDRSIDTDAASCSITIRNQRHVGWGETVERPVAGAGVGVPQLPQYGDPGYLTPDRGASEAAQNRWGYVNEQPIVYEGIHGSKLLDGGFLAHRGYPHGETVIVPTPDILDPAWTVQATAAPPSPIEALNDGAANTYLRSRFRNATPYQPGGTDYPFDPTIHGGARCFVTGNTALAGFGDIVGTPPGFPDIPLPEQPKILGIQVWAHVSVKNTMDPDLKVYWEPSLMMWDPDFVDEAAMAAWLRTSVGNEGGGGPSFPPPPGGYTIHPGGAVHMTTDTSPDVFISSEIFRSNPRTGNQWAAAEINQIVNGHDHGKPNGFGLRAFTKTAYWSNSTHTTKKTSLSEGAMHVYDLWCDVLVESPEGSWAQVIAPNSLLRTYQGYGGHDLEWDDAVREGYLLRTGTWLVDRVVVKTDGDIEVECRDMAKLLINQPLMPPIVPPLQYPMRWISDFGDRIKSFHRGKRNWTGGSVGKGPPAGTRSQSPIGNYRDLCADETTEIFTRRGWLRWNEVQIGDETLSIDQTTGLSDWCSIDGVYRKQRSRSMTLMEGASFSAKTTPDHRWLVQDAKGRWRWKTTETLIGEDSIPLAVERNDVPQIKKYDDDFVDLVAWFWTEGWWNGGARFAQSVRVNPDNVELIEKMLHRYLGPPGPLQRGGYNPPEAIHEAVDSVRAGMMYQAAAAKTGVSVKTIKKYLHEPYKEKAVWRYSDRHDGVRTYTLAEPLRRALRLVLDDDKVPSMEFLSGLSQTQLKRFLDLSIKADGWESGVTGFSQDHKGRSDAFASACALAGKATVTHFRDNRTWETTLLVCPRVNPVRAAKLQGSMSVTEETYDGVVWCPTLKSGNWLARRNGSVYFTGNTEIVRWFLLWSGWWLYNETEQWSLPFSQPAAETIPTVFGNLETTGSKPEADMNPEMFDKQKVIDGINSIKELVGYCVDESTQILTKRGWLNHDEVRVGDEAFSLDPKDGMSCWRLITHLYKDQGQFDMVEMKTRLHDSLTTPDHRWITRSGGQGKYRFRETRALTGSDDIPIARPQKELSTVSAFREGLAELSGWWWTEGSYAGKGAFIAQSRLANPENWERIRCLLEKMYGPSGKILNGRGNVHNYETVLEARRLRSEGWTCPDIGEKLGVEYRVVWTWCERGSRTQEWRRWSEQECGFRIDSSILAELEEIAPNKVFSLDAICRMSQAELDSILYTSWLGDGHVNGVSQGMSQASPARQDAFQTVCALAGRGCHFYERKDRPGHYGGTILKVKNVQPLSAVRLGTACSSIQNVSYSGTVWCPTVQETGTWLARRNGKVYFTGNCFRIDHDGAARFEPPNFFTNGNFYPDGTHTPFIYEIDESVNLVDFGITHTDDDIRSEIIISSFEPTTPLNDTVTTRFMTPNRRLLRGMARPFAWVNESFTKRSEQKKMAELIGLHIWFSQRQGQAQCAANPALEIDDQVRFWERITSEAYIHYVRGIQTSHNLEEGEYMMTLTTHWLGTPEEWEEALGWRLSTATRSKVEATSTSIARPGLTTIHLSNLGGKVSRGKAST